MAKERKPAEPCATAEFRFPFMSVRVDGLIPVLAGLSVVVAGLAILYFLVFSPAGDEITGGPTTAAPSPVPAAVPSTSDPPASGSGAGAGGGTGGADSSIGGGDAGAISGSGVGDSGVTRGVGGSAGGGGNNRSTPAPVPVPAPVRTPAPVLAPVPPPPAPTGSFLNPSNGEQVIGKTYSARGTVDGLPSSLTLLCIVKGVDAPYFFYDTYGVVRGVNGNWRAELGIGPDPPHRRTFTLSLATATQSAVDEINAHKANATSYNEKGLSKIPSGVEMLDEVVIDRTS